MVARLIPFNISKIFRDHDFSILYPLVRLVKYERGQKMKHYMFAMMISLQFIAYVVRNLHKTRGEGLHRAVNGFKTLR
jgi:hypothetical protein